MFISVCFEGVVNTICCPGIFEFRSKFANGIFDKVDNIRPRVPQGGGNIGLRGNQRFRNNKNRKQKALSDESAMQMAPTWDPTSDSLEYYG